MNRRNSTDAGEGEGRGRAKGEASSSNRFTGFSGQAMPACVTAMTVEHAADEADAADFGMLGIGSLG